MTKPAPLAIISSLTGIVACALLGATQARADYAVTIDQEGSTVVATSTGGTFNLTGSTPGFPIGVPQNGTVLAPSAGVLTFGSIGSLPNSIAVTGPSNFGPSGPTVMGTSISGPILGINASLGSLFLPATLTVGPSVATFPTTLAALGLTRGASDTWTWGAGGPNQSFTINVVPGPIVGAGLPGLIAALGGLVALARRSRKQLA